MSKEGDPMHMFGVKYHDHEFFAREDDFRMNFEDVHVIYHRDALDISIFTI
jgi:hypothetical protein